ncbi:MAG: response regulator [Candidatus Pacebacteria bacterium]|nr:response regulator [Candidatus Paceibacterota bacterium]
MKENSETKVLIIEDDVYISEMYKIKFESENYKTVITNNGSEVINLIKKEKPNIILLDIVMPVMDGFDVLKIIKSNKKFNNIPVVMLTNLSQKESIERVFELGAKGYIVKSHFTPSEVVKKVKDILDGNESDD